MGYIVSHFFFLELVSIPAVHLFGRDVRGVFPDPIEWISGDASYDDFKYFWKVAAYERKA